MSNKLEQVAVRLEPELRYRLQAQADADMRPLAAMIRKILHDAIVAPPATGANAGAVR
jgi:predicted DNA-binding protein